MNAVAVSVRDLPEPPWLGKVAVFADRVLSRMGEDSWDLSVVLCGDAFIAALNEEYRHKDGPTDVLSFEQGDWYQNGEESRFLAGDVVLSLEALARNAEDFSVTEGEELKRLLVHGILHLSGMDHATNDPGEPMLVRQEELLIDLAEERIL